MNALIISLKVLICEVSTSCESFCPSFIVEAIGRLSLIHVGGIIKSILLRVDRLFLNKLKAPRHHGTKITGLKLTAICQLIKI